MNEQQEVREELLREGWTRCQFVQQPNIPYFAIIGMSPEGRIVSGRSDKDFREAYMDLKNKNYAAGAMEDVNV